MSPPVVGLSPPGSGVGGARSTPLRNVLNPARLRAPCPAVWKRTRIPLPPRGCGRGRGRGGVENSSSMLGSRSPGPSRVARSTLLSEARVVRARGLRVVAWLAYAAAVLWVVRVEAHVDQLPAFVRMVVVDGAGSSAHAAMATPAVAFAHASRVARQHQGAAPEVPRGGVRVAVGPALPVRFGPALPAPAALLDDVRTARRGTHLEHTRSFPDVMGAARPAAPDTRGPRPMHCPGRGPDKNGMEPESLPGYDSSPLQITSGQRDRKRDTPPARSARPR